MILVTGGTGFIGSNFVLDWIKTSRGPVVNLDKLTYAGNPTNLASVQAHPLYSFVHGDIGDREKVRRVLAECRPNAIVNFAAESHVDRSILGPEDFIQTNIVGTFHLLEEIRCYWSALPPEQRRDFRFLHVSTDEVYGSLRPEEAPFSEAAQYSPNSPYSASKAASDHLVRAYMHTYGVPVLTTNCSNNYGPYQFPEKFIPLLILNAIAGKPLPVYGDGQQVRDWLYVADHCAAIRTVLTKGAIGETYNIGGSAEMPNIQVVRAVCALLDELAPDAELVPRAQLIAHVRDRPGHDRRYAIDARKIQRDLGWAPIESFASGLRKTIEWYLNHMDWAKDVTSGGYKQWVSTQYGV